MGDNKKKVKVLLELKGTKPGTSEYRRTRKRGHRFPRQNLVSKAWSGEKEKNRLEVKD